MNSITFERRINNGKANHLTYSKDGLDGLISVWMHDSTIILTWEECPKGEQYNESTYTRDERYVFSTFTELMMFLSQHGLAMDAFVLESL